MHKIGKLFVIAIVCVLALSACGAESESVNSTIQTNTPPIDTHNQEFETPTEPLLTEQNKPADTLYPAFYFTFNDTTISLNQNMQELLDVLEEPSGIRQTPSCAFDGYDRIFGFGAINIHTYPQGELDFVQIISLRNDNVTTIGGIRLGDSWDRVVEAYGIDYTQDFSIYTFTKGVTTLSFYVEDGIILEITYALIMD